MKTIFLGDSITEGYDLRRFFGTNEFSNHGISGFSTGELLDAMQENWFEGTEKRIMLCIGTNDLARNIEFKTIIKNTQLIVQKALSMSNPGCRVYIQSLFPTRHNPPRPNPLISQYNTMLHQFCVQNSYSYLHFHPFFADHNGQLSREYTDDGLHLTFEAYETWTHLLNLLFQSPKL